MLIIPVSERCRGGEQKDWCTCLSGFEGGTIRADGTERLDCEIDIDECESNPCGNGATCLDSAYGSTWVLPDEFKCQCPVGKEGEICELDTYTALTDFFADSCPCPEAMLSFKVPKLGARIGMTIGPAIISNSVEYCARACLHESRCESFDYRAEVLYEPAIPAVLKSNSLTQMLSRCLTARSEGDPDSCGADCTYTFPEEEVPEVEFVPGKCWLKSMRILDPSDNSGAAGQKNYEKMEEGYATCTDPDGVVAPDYTFATAEACAEMGDCRNPMGTVTMLKGVSREECDANVFNATFVPNTWLPFYPCVEEPNCWLEGFGWDNDGGAGAVTLTITLTLSGDVASVAGAASSPDRSF